MKLTTRHLFRGKGVHRPRPVVLAEDLVPGVVTSHTVLPEAQLLDGWPVPKPYGAVVVQCFDDCTPCGHATAGVLTRDGWRCGECLQIGGAA